jgi:LPS-assembly lipoprotein
MKQIVSILVIAASLGVAACGFRPLYAPIQYADGTSALDNVWIETIADENGMILRNYLLDSFYSDGYPETARYNLKITLHEFVRNADIQKNDTTTRAQLVMLANYTLQDRVTQQVLETQQVRSIVGYNILLSSYTTMVSRKDARDRGLRDIAEKIQTRVALILSDQQTGSAAP